MTNPEHQSIMDTLNKYTDKISEAIDPFKHPEFRNANTHILATAMVRVAGAMALAVFNDFDEVEEFLRNSVDSVTTEQRGTIDLTELRSKRQ